MVLVHDQGESVRQHELLERDRDGGLCHEVLRTGSEEQQNK